MERNTFCDDLKFGKRYEYKLIDILSDYDEAEIINGLSYDFDVKIMKDSLATTYEVKSDRFGLKTGNFCIEYQHRSKPSGILKSKADFYAIFLVDDSIEKLYIIPLSVLKNALDGNSFRTRQLGYQKQSTCMMIPVDVFKEYQYSF